MQAGCGHVWCFDPVTFIYVTNCQSFSASVLVKAVAGDILIFCDVGWGIFSVYMFKLVCEK